MEAYEKENFELSQENHFMMDQFEELALSGIFSFQLDSPKEIWTNPMLSKILGIKNSDINLGIENWDTLIDKQDLNNALDNFKNHDFTLNKLYRQTVRYKHKNGSFVWIQCKGLHLNDHHGNPERILVHYTDITEQKKLEIQVRELKQQLKQESQVISLRLEDVYKELSDYKIALDESSIVAITDQRGTINFVNDKFCQISKYSETELLGQDHRIVNSGYHSKEFFKELWTTIAKGKIWRGDIKNKAKDGTYYWVDTTIVPFIDGKGKPFKYVSIRADISTRKNAEEQLQMINKELEIFTYSVSHDLRAPLRAVTGYSKILLEDYETVIDQDGNKVIKSIIKNSKKMNELIDDLLAFSRLGRRELSLNEINMTSLVKSVFEEESQNIDTIIDYKAIELLPAMGDQTLIKQVWTDLLSNAFKYSGLQSVIQIEIGSYMQKNMVVYYIKDNGIGFDMQHYNKLFGVFQRLNLSEEFEGTGIGLAIVKKIIQKHGGNIWAESELHKGATFYFTLPEINI